MQFILVNMLHNSDTIHRCRNGKLTTITSKGKCFQEIYIHPIALQIYNIHIHIYIYRGNPITVGHLYNIGWYTPPEEDDWRSKAERRNTRKDERKKNLMMIATVTQLWQIYVIKDASTFHALLLWYHKETVRCVRSLLQSDIARLVERKVG